MSYTKTICVGEVTRQPVYFPARDDLQSALFFTVKCVRGDEGQFASYFSVKLSGGMADVWVDSLSQGDKVAAAGEVTLNKAKPEYPELVLYVSKLLRIDGYGDARQLMADMNGVATLDAIDAFADEDIF